MLRVFMSPWFIALWAVGSVLLVLFQTLVWFRVRSQFESWQPVTATILESWVNAHTEMDGEYVREPVIKFSYVFRGTEYVSDRPFWRSFTLGPRFVDLSDLALQYKKGDKVIARLHPKYPELCFLAVANFDFKSVFLLAGGVLLTGAGSYFLGWFLSPGSF